MDSKTGFADKIRGWIRTRPLVWIGLAAFLGIVLSIPVSPVHDELDGEIADLEKLIDELSDEQGELEDARDEAAQELEVLEGALADAEVRLVEAADLAAEAEADADLARENLAAILAAAQTQEDGAEPEPEPERDFTENDLEYMLAVIDGAATNVDDPILGRYAKALNAADRNCVNDDRQAISDQAALATQLLAEDGVDATTLEMLQGVGQIREARQLGLDCSELFASLTILTR